MEAARDNMFSGAKINSTEVSGSSGLRFCGPHPRPLPSPLFVILSSSSRVFTLPLKQCFCLMKVLKDFSVGVVAELWGVSSLGLAAWTWRANWNSAWCLSREGHSSSLKGEICLRFAQTFFLENFNFGTRMDPCCKLHKGQEESCHQGP